MTNKITPWKVGIATGLMLTIGSLLCAILFWIAPEITLNLANNVFHGIDLTQIAKSSLSLGGVIIGLLVTFIVGFISGWIFAVIYNKIMVKW